MSDKGTDRSQSEGRWSGGKAPFWARSSAPELRGGRTSKAEQQRWPRRVTAAADHTDGRGGEAATAVGRRAGRFERAWMVDRTGKLPGELRDPCHVCFLPDERRVAVADRLNHRLQIFRTDATAVEIFSRTESPCLNNPTSICAPSDTQHLVADGDKIHFIDQTGTCGKDWKPNPPRKQERIAIHGLALDTNNNNNFILSNLSLKPTVEAYSQQTGKLQRAFELATDYRCPRHLAFNPERGLLYVSDSEAGTVHIFDQRERFCLRTIGGRRSGCPPSYGQLISPHGVHVDAKGLLYVTDKAQDYVARFTPSGRFYGYVLTEADGVKDPVGVALSPADDKMAVIERQLDFSRDRYTLAIYESSA